MGNEDSARLYFIPIIARALKREDQARAMEEAFDEIRQLGKRPEYEEGFAQFLEFVRHAVEADAGSLEEGGYAIEEAVHGILCDLATGTFEGSERQKETLLGAVTSDPRWRAEYETLMAESSDFLAPDAPMQVEVVKGEKLIGSLVIGASEGTTASITPGKYTIRLSNGRELWEGTLSKEDVLWAYAYPDKNLPMAAATEAPAREPTRVIRLLGAELNLLVYAGLESGEMTLEKDTL